MPSEAIKLHRSKMRKDIDSLIQESEEHGYKQEITKLREVRDSLTKKWQEDDSNESFSRSCEHVLETCPHCGLRRDEPKELKNIIL